MDGWRNDALKSLGLMAAASASPQKTRDRSHHPLKQKLERSGYFGYNNHRIAVSTIEGNRQQVNIQQCFALERKA